MVGEHKKRINLTLHEMSVDMLEMISKKTGITKSKIARRMFKAYTLMFWGNPDEEIEKWKLEMGNKNDKPKK